MGTRSLTHVKDESGATLVTIYRQYDGYPTGMGADLLAILRGRTVVNGYGVESDSVSNGMGCLAATIVKRLKDSTGNVYIYPPDSIDCGEEYVYTITLSHGVPYLGIAAAGEAHVLHYGPANDLTDERLGVL